MKPRLRKLSNLTSGPSQPLHYIVLFTTNPTTYHLSIYFSVEIIYISIVYTTVPFLTFKVFSIFYLPIGLPHSIGLNVNHGLHPSLLTWFLQCSQLEYLRHPLKHVSLKSQSSLIVSLSPRECLAWRGLGAWWWWWFEFNFVYPSVPLVSSLNIHYHSFCSYSDHLT